MLALVYRLVRRRVPVMAKPNERAEPREARDQEWRGFVTLPKRVLFDRALSAVDLRVLATIAAYDWGEESAGCLLAYETIGERAVASESSAKRSIKKLQALHYIFAPAARVIGGRRYGTVIRLTSRARDTGVSKPEAVRALQVPPMQLSLDGANVDLSTRGRSGGGSNVDPLAKARRKKSSSDGANVNPLGDERVHADLGDGSKLACIIDTKTNTQQHEAVVAEKVFRPDLVREQVVPSDAPRLRLLDGFGCSDSADWFGLLLGALANRERALGREPDAARLRSAFDGAIAKRSVARAENPLGFLLAGIERGFLLANPRSEKKGSTLDPSTFYALPVAERARIVVAVAHGRSHGAAAEVVRVVNRLLAERPGMAGRVDAGETQELEP